MKKRFSIALMILGIILFTLGSHEAYQANQRGQILTEEDQGYRRATLGPVRRNVRAQENQSIQERYSEASQSVIATLTSANWLRGSGIVLLLVGASCFVFCRKRR